MDLCNRRYANPFDMLSFQIELNSCAKFIKDLDQIITEEKIWDVWLHKVEDKNFEQFRRLVLGNSGSPSKKDNKTDIEDALESARDAISQF